ncbi:ABC transporter substrate-binding protein [Cyanobacterium stanieri LEGE 03274]|uniref:ABC transporter substrate-binding protein n=1 Tax=Cyanobacterium stanieri LEGE 03274 TaxID=1828756 RepID=A0ABR9V4W8_9CHRO|nr:ABC transporter substrate-binding protein [Cyanobacterium stanieri]MBE9222928.1 ABC transporter substrate-binding protein [Cyanobacterium stanieri LEGE 03274]
MKNQITKLLLLSLSLITITACNNSENITLQENQQESINTELETVNQPQKIVALTSLTADIIYQLNPEKLVGIPGSSLTRNDPRFADYPTVSEGNTPPDLEKIVALEPDLVIGAEGFSDQTLAKLEEVGIKTISTNVDSLESLTTLTQNIASIMGENAQPLLQNYQRWIPPQINADTSALVLVSRQPILAPNKNSWAGDLLNQFQFNNVVADLQGSSQFGGYVTLSPEKILATNPDIIILVDPGQQGIEEQMKAESFWGDLRAVKEDKVYVFDYYGLVNPGNTVKVEETVNKLSALMEE